jgi:two-component system, oxyanion-binding sensor
MVVRLGLLRLADSLPVLVAERQRWFAAERLDVRLSVEPSWSNVADKLAFGALDAAVMLPPLALAAAAGLRGPAVRLLVPMALSEGGNSVVLNEEAALAATGPAGNDPAEAARRLGGWMRRQRERPRLAVVHVFSTHALLLRDWLASGGVDPDRDAELVAIPPAEVVDALAAGRVAGFCAGAPWGDEAARRGAGRVVLGTKRMRPGHMEKCLAVAEWWAAEQGEELMALVRALRRAGPPSDAVADAPAHAALLAGPPLHLPLDATLAALAGVRSERPRFHVAPDRPSLQDARWYAAQLRRWGWLDGEPDALARHVFRSSAGTLAPTD